ncbi:MAG: ABC transporter ATP-binding protein [Pseudomonadota bacterium]
MSTEDAILSVDGLAVAFSSLRGEHLVIEDVSFDLAPGKIMGVVGESGSGKSVTALAIMRLLGDQGRIARGTVRLAGQDLTGLSEPAMRPIRGRDVAMIFQEPMTSLNPVYTVGFQIAEVLIEHLGMTRREAFERASSLMEEVGIPAAADRLDDYPHQLSGGMRQRAMIAMALACEPKILIADEPTTALDVTIQAQILNLIRSLRDRHGTAVLMITHDMGVIAEMSDDVTVMYAGRVVEKAPVDRLFEAPQHPYTHLLLRSVPRLTGPLAKLQTIAGAMPSPAAQPDGCRFHPRCPFVIDRCRHDQPPLTPHCAATVSCWRAGDFTAAAVA